MSTISDPFTDADGTALSAHAFPGGYSWVRDYGSPDDLVINSNRVDASAGGVAVFYRTTAVPTSADVRVRLVLNLSGTGGVQYVDLIGRGQSGTVAGDRYYARLNPGTLKWNIFKGVSGSDTQIGGDSTGYLFTTVEFDITGTSLTLYGDGSIVLGPVTDSAISAAGSVGFAIPSSVSGALPTIDTFEADSAGFSGAGGSANGAAQHYYRQLRG